MKHRVLSYNKYLQINFAQNVKSQTTNIRKENNLTDCSYQCLILHDKLISLALYEQFQAIKVLACAKQGAKGRPR